MMPRNTQTWKLSRSITIYLLPSQVIHVDFVEYWRTCTDILRCLIRLWCDFWYKIFGIQNSQKPFSIGWRAGLDSHNSVTGNFALLWVLTGLSVQFRDLPFVVFVIKSSAKARVGHNKLNLITNRCLSSPVSNLHFYPPFIITKLH